MSKEVNKSPVFYDRYECPLGSLYLIFSGRFLSGIFFKKPSGIPFKKVQHRGISLKNSAHILMV
jgi:hypothetical protein